MAITSEQLKEYMPIVFTAITKLNLNNFMGGSYRDDFIQEGLIAINKKCETEGEAISKRLAYVVAYREIVDYLRVFIGDRRTKTQENYYDRTISYEEWQELNGFELKEEGFEDDIISMVYSEKVKELISKLPSEKQRILATKIIIEGGRQSDLYTTLGVSDTRICQINKVMIKKLKEIYEDDIRRFTQVQESKPAFHVPDKNRSFGDEYRIVYPQTKHKAANG